LEKEWLLMAIACGLDCIKGERLMAEGNRRGLMEGSEGEFYRALMAGLMAGRAGRCGASGRRCG
jgi:hypothetical protein